MRSTVPPTPRIGVLRPDYDVPVINERAVRAGAGILFLGGAIAMLRRVTAGDRWSPTLTLGRLVVYRQQPEWVGAPQKAFAWWLGFALALVACSSMGLLAAPLWLTLALCGLCLSLLFLETAFGICVGCALQRVLSKTSPQYCPGGTCTTN